MKDYVSFDILSEGTIIDPSIEVISFHINKEVNRIPVATIVIREGYHTPGDPLISDSDFFSPGKKIEIKGGWDGKNTTLFKGIVSHQQLQSGPENLTLTIGCRDEAVQLTSHKRRANFTEKKDSDIIRDILHDNGITSQVEDTSTQHGQLVQNNVSDWDFILARAKANGLLVIPDDGTVHVKAPDLSAQKKLTLTYGENLMELETTTVPFHQQAKKVAYSALRMTRGRVKTEGFGPIKPGDLMELKEVGKRFSGTVFVSGVQHDFAEGNWDTHIRFGFDEKWPGKQVEASSPTATTTLTNGEDKSPQKSLETEGGMKILLDDEAKTLSVETPAGNKITLNEDSQSILITDQNQNSIKMDNTGIALHSPKDIHITADGNINLEATQNLNLTGLKIAAAAQSELDLQGTASAKLSSSAIVDVQGSLVKIN